MADRFKIRPSALPESLRVFWRRRELLRAIWLVVVLVGVVAAFLTPSVYESPVVMGLEGLARPGGPARTDTGADPRIQADLMSEQVRNHDFLRSAITASGIDKDPATRAWALRSAKRYPGSAPDEAVVAFLIDHLRQGTVVTPGEGNTFRVTVADRNRERARRHADAMGNQFVRWSQESQIQEVGEVQESSLERQETAKHRLEESETRLARALQSIGAGNMPEQPGNIARIQALEQKAKLEADDARRRVEALKKQLAGRVSDEDLARMSGGRVSDIASQMETLERQLASATLTEATDASLGPARLAVVRKHSELASELSRAAARSLPGVPEAVRELAVYYRLAQGELAGIEARRDWLARQVTSSEQRAVMAPEHERELQRLTNEVKSNQALHDSLVRQSAASQLAEAFEAGKLSGRLVVLETARWPGAAARPNRPGLVLLAIVAGGLIGAATVMVVERFDPSVKNAEEVGGLLGLRVLGALPRVAELEVRRGWPFAVVPGGTPASPEHGLLSRLKVDTPLGLELRRIYLELSLRRGRRLPHTLAVTSATRGEGKSTAAAGLAITMARELRQKVLLVDFDLRSPGLHRALGLPNSSWGLAQILGERHFDARFVRATVLPHLDFLPAGKIDRLVDELIEAELVEWFVKEAVGRYPIVILDCAPNLTVPDPLIIGRAVEGVIFVVKAGSTVRKAVENGVHVQREWRDNVLGVVINDAGDVLPQYAVPSHEYHEAGDEVAGSES